MSPGMRVRCERHTWVLGEKIGGGAWGAVFGARSDTGGTAAAKLVEKHPPRTARELLFTDLTDVRNVVPVIDDGETDEHWVIVMPRAEKSLREHMDDHGRAFDLASTTAILIDVATTLVDLDERDPAVVHRDVKPDNILWLHGNWCLADFGLSRYAEATTGKETWKSKWSSWYAAPERWEERRASSATDVYALGVIGYELMLGTRPFISTRVAELQRMHCKVTPTFPRTAPLPLVELVEECLYKQEGSRPSAASLLHRLELIRSRHR